MNYQQRWRLAVALKRPYPSLTEAGALEMVPGSEPPVFIDRMGFFELQPPTDPQRKADLKTGLVRGLALGATVAALGAWAAWPRRHGRA